MEMIKIALEIILAMAAGALTAGVAAWLGWTLLSWTHHPGWGPLLAFVILAATIHGSDFTQMVLLFSGILALLGLTTLGNSEVVRSSDRAARRAARHGMKSL